MYGIYLNHEGRVLLIKDSSSDLWGLPGGGVEESENDQQALRRESREEVGLTIDENMRYVTREESTDKVRRFYSIMNAQGEISKRGNSDDVLGADFFEVKSVSSRGDTVPGLGALLMKHLALDSQ